MRVKRMVFYCLAGLMAGCLPIPSLNPLFTEESIIFDEGLLGTWLQDANDPNTYWQFARLEESSTEGLPQNSRRILKQAYRLNLVRQGEQEGAFVACLTKLGDRRFLDIFADRFPSGQSLYGPEKAKLNSNRDFFAPMHVFARVDALSDQLKMRFLDVNDFGKLIEVEPKALAYGVTERGGVLTASTEELQAFVTKHADDGRLFTTEMPALIRKSK